MYAFVSAKTLYVLDENFAILQTHTLNEQEMLSVGEYELCQTEKKLESEFANIRFCNYKKHTNKTVTNPQILAKILVHAKPNAQVSTTLTAHKLQVYNWDVSCIQAIRSISELDTQINVLSRRLREWYEWHNPEISKKIASHQAFAKTLTLEQDTQQGELFVEFPQSDMQMIRQMAKGIYELTQLRDQTSEYVQQCMFAHLPTFSAIAGAQIGAKLLSIAQSAKNLSRLTASTMQVLGAEKALFRHLKTGSKPPKYGILYQHPLVAKSKNKGKTARALANVLVISARADYFQSADSTLAQQLLKKVERVSNT
ncbi:MAG: hypothetical protein ACMXYF_02605 [Candidatus Woesearchaeota archaeon]